VSLKCSIISYISRVVPFLAGICIDQRHADLANGEFIIILLKLDSVTQ